MSKSEANPSDVSSIDAIITAAYDSISGPAGEKRNWDRERSLYYPGARLIPTAKPGENDDLVPQILDIDGFIARAEDPRRQIVACAGAPICAAAEISTRSLAPSLAKTAVAGADVPLVHLSGCAKGCACSRSTPLTVVGIHGQCGVVVNGSARDEPVVILGPEALPDALSRVADAVRRMHAADENSAEVLSRLDRRQLARLMLGEATDA